MDFESFKKMYSPEEEEKIELKTLLVTYIHKELAKVLNIPSEIIEKVNNGLFHLKVTGDTYEVVLNDPQD